MKLPVKRGEKKAKGIKEQASKDIKLIYLISLPLEFYVLTVWFILTCAYL